MAIALNEDEAGRNREIWFPNLQSCLGFTVVLDDGQLLGAHLTMPTTLDQVQDIGGYFHEIREGANIISMLLIGHIGEWRRKAEQELRSGGNLRQTLRGLMNTDCVIYQYDSVQSASGGLGATAHLIHQGGAFPYPHVDLFKPNACPVASWLDSGHPLMANLEIKRSYAAGQLGQERGMRAPRSVAVMADVGTKTKITEGMMKKK